MSEEQSTENIQSDDDPSVETNFEELFTKARSMSQFKKYSNFELKEKLVNLVFSMDDISVTEDEEGQTKESPQKVNIKQDKLQEIINELENSLSKGRKRKNKEIKESILSRKKRNLTSQKDGYPILYDRKSIDQLLFKLAQDIDAYHGDIFWDFSHYSDKDFIRFRKEIAHHYYLIDHHFFRKIWDRLAGQRESKIENSDPFQGFEIYPKKIRKKLYGSNYYTTRLLDESWANLLFGRNRTAESRIPIEESHNYSFLAVITGLSQTFDDIFNWANIQFTEESVKDGLADEGAGAVINEGLLFKLVSDSFIPVINILNTFDHITFTLPLTENHPLRSMHLVYFAAWIYVRWIPFLEKTLRETKNIITPTGETGPISLTSVFESVKLEMDNELVAVDFDQDLGHFYSYFTEREEILKKMDYYSNYIPELKKRIKYLLSSLSGDLYRDYFDKKGYYLQYHVDERGLLRFDHLIRKDTRTLFQKLFSFVLPEKKELLSEKILDKEKKSVEKEVRRASQRVSLSLQKDYSSYSRTLEDLLTILTVIAPAFDGNFDPENQLHRRPNDEFENYEYLSNNPFFINEEKVSFDHVKVLQDYYDYIFMSKSQGENLLQDIRSNKSPRDLNPLFDDMESSLEDLSTLIKDTSVTLGILTQNKSKYKEYSLLINKFQFVYTEYQKVKDVT